MSIKSINEGFEKQFCEKPLKEEKGKHFDLLMALKRAREALEKRGERNLKSYEIAYQDVIEDYFPDKLWWEVVDFNIFDSLFNDRDPQKTEIEIVKHVVDPVEEGLEADTTQKDTTSKDGAIVKRKNKINELLNGNTINISPSVSADVSADVHDVSTGDIASAGLGKPTTNESKRRIKEGCHRRHAKKRIKESFKVTQEIDLDDFDFWGPAEERFYLLTDDEKQMAQEWIEDAYPDGIDKTSLNDMFAYDDDFICQLTGLEDIDDFYDRRR